MLSFKMRNLKGLENDTTSNHEDFSSRQHSEPVVEGCFIEKLPLVVLKNIYENTYIGVFFNKVPRLTLVKIDSGHVLFAKC